MWCPILFQSILSLTAIPQKLYLKFYALYELCFEYVLINKLSYKENLTQISMRMWFTNYNNSMRKANYNKHVIYSNTFNSLNNWEPNVVCSLNNCKTYIYMLSSNNFIHVRIKYKTWKRSCYVPASITKKETDYTLVWTS